MGVDVTVVGSGPNGLTAAVILRPGRIVRARHRGAAAPRAAVRAPCPTRSSGVGHDICSAVHPLALASPFFAAYDLPARGVRLAVPEISYASPLTDRPAAVGYRDIERTCAELSDGDSLATTARPARPPTATAWWASSSATSGRCRRRSPRRQAWRPGCWPRATPLWRTARRRGRPRIVHRRCRTHHFADAVAGGRRRRVDAGHPGTCGGLADPGRRIPGHPGCADRRPARTRRGTGPRRGGHRTTGRRGALRHRAHRAAVRSTARTARRGMQRPCSRYRYGPGVAKVDFVLSRRDALA